MNTEYDDEELDKMVEEAAKAHREEDSEWFDNMVNKKPRKPEPKYGRKYYEEAITKMFHETQADYRAGTDAGNLNPDGKLDLAGKSNSFVAGYKHQTGLLAFQADMVRPT